MENRLGECLGLILADLDARLPRDWPSFGEVPVEVYGQGCGMIGLCLKQQHVAWSVEEAGRTVGDRKFNLGPRSSGSRHGKEGTGIGTFVG